MDRPAGKLLSFVETPEVSALVDAAVAKYTTADDVWSAAIWLIARQHAGAKVGKGKPQRYAVELPPVRESRSPGLVVRYYYEDDGNCHGVIEWVHFYDYDENKAISPAPPTQHSSALDQVGSGAPYSYWIGSGPSSMSAPIGAFSTPVSSGSFCTSA